ncbi:hypothetical protein DXG03_006750 [Asterophora parasitica]|uniref:Uncharacterized protein n=1 Tax=Asterophora parasitica TaxID=117018 RepID=A0A9P7G506_9AGAR|nr:hypothetical protein DXG03_006750 [Asterophora parasitica]
MGTCSRVTFTYGFILNEAQIKKLLAAIDPEDGDEFTPGGNWREVLPVWLESDECDIAPYFFTAEAKCTPYYESRITRLDPSELEAELAFSFIGSRKAGISMYDTEVWGRDIQCTLFEAIDQPWADEEFMAMAKEALKKLKNTEAFKKAELTNLVPQWFTTLSIG